METAWDKTRAIGFAVGMHVLVLTLLCLGFMRESPQQITGADGSIIEASLVDVPLQSDSRPADSMPKSSQQPKLIALRVPPHSIVNQVEERQAKEQAAEHSEQQDSDVHPNQALIDPSRQQQPDDGYPQHLAQQQSDPQDLLQEMRKQRAEQEHQRQLMALDSDAPQVQHAQADGSNTLPVLAHQLVENGIADQRFLDPFSTLIEFNLGADGIPDEGRQLMNCPVAAFQRRKDDMFPMDWIDCLLNPAKYHLAGQRIDFPHIGFAQTSSIQGVEVDHIGTEPQATPAPQADHRAFEPDN